jgi:hypothetical protein
MPPNVAAGVPRAARAGRRRVSAAPPPARHPARAPDAARPLPQRAPLPPARAARTALRMSGKQAAGDDGKGSKTPLAKKAEKLYHALVALAFAALRKLATVGAPPSAALGAIARRPPAALRAFPPRPPPLLLL